jgi:hypothetical protein
MHLIGVVSMSSTGRTPMCFNAVVINALALMVVVLNKHDFNVMHTITD